MRSPSADRPSEKCGSRRGRDLEGCRAEEACSVIPKRGGLEQSTLMDKERTRRATAVLLRMGEPGCCGTRRSSPHAAAQQTVHTDTVCEVEGPWAAWRPFCEQKLLLHPRGWGGLIKRVPLCVLHPGGHTSVGPPAPPLPCCAGPCSVSRGGHSRWSWGTLTAGAEETASVSSSPPVAPAPLAGPLGLLQCWASHTLLVFERWGQSWVRGRPGRVEGSQSEVLMTENPSGAQPPHLQWARGPQDLLISRKLSFSAIGSTRPPCPGPSVDWLLPEKNTSQ